MRSRIPENFSENSQEKFALGNREASIAKGTLGDVTNKNASMTPLPVCNFFSFIISTYSVSFGTRVCFSLIFSSSICSEFVSKPSAWQKIMSHLKRPYTSMILQSIGKTIDVFKHRWGLLPVAVLINSQSEPMRNGWWLVSLSSSGQKNYLSTNREASASRTKYSEYSLCNAIKITIQIPLEKYRHRTTIQCAFRDRHKKGKIVTRPIKSFILTINFHNKYLMKFKTNVSIDE